MTDFSWKITMTLFTVDHFWESRALEDTKGTRVGRTHTNMDKGLLLKMEGDEQNKGSKPKLSVIGWP